MPREQYQSQLVRLREDVLTIGQIVIERFRMGLDVIETRQEALARKIRDSDKEVNELYLDIESICVDLFALQQPVATDLRFIVASFRISTDPERIADLAVNLAEYSVEVDEETFPDVDLREIGNVAVEMLGDAIEAYSAEDTWGCHEVAADDDELDALCERSGKVIVRDLIEAEMRSEAATEDLMRDVFWLTLVIRDLERIGDHIVNIAVRTLYMIENDAELI